MPTKIWRLTWSHALGTLWLHMHTTTDDLADFRLSQYRQDEPGALYVAAPTRPDVRADQESRARHFAPLT